MTNSEILTGLDIGSGKVTCIVAEYDEDKQRLRVLGGSVAESKGLKTGMVTNIEDAAKSIRAAVEAAEKRAGQGVVSEVMLGIRGPHIHSQNARGKLGINRADKEITLEDVAGVIDNSKAFTLDHGSELLHVVPQKFSLDRLQGVPNPVGMQGNLLEAETHMVMGSSPAITNLLKAVSEAGFSLAAAPVYLPLALGELLVSDEEKSLGVLLVDIGGQTTSMAIYADGALQYSRELPFGGDNISKDLAHGLGTTINWAKELKEKYGAAYTALVKSDALIKVMKADRRSTAELRPRDFLKFIQPRVEEFYELIYEAVQKTPYTELSGGVILTGGGALLKGMPEAARELLELPQARLAVPVRDLLICHDEYQQQPYLGAVALTCYPYLKPWGSDLHTEYETGGLLTKLANWFREVF